ncbi:MAG: hypothetical protein NZ901_08925 [Geminocystis sp.]|nr:hypothetical protein [Geminocystis sp.]MCS7148298.1 hypothetical protein [Geminocystis sp.]MDW8116605.1 RuBisCO accumulation factor 1 [Geminocystis sp.]MDW8462215.1 RuBisCO accumulation factor 1 [Geminocystis sp.]
MADIKQEKGKQEKNLTEEEKQKIIETLKHKEGCWVDWGKACQTLQDNGMTEEEIFEKTGFQSSHQNLVMVASKVYDSLVKAEAEETLLEYYRGSRSDILYELRILNLQERLAAARLIYEKKLDVDAAKEVAKAVKEFSRLSQPPAGFSFHPGDAVAYQYWKMARQKKEVGEKARLIAEGLKFAHTEAARQKIETLLTELNVVTPKTPSPPLLPIYRLESDEELPCILPVVGRLPLQAEVLKNITHLKPKGPFGVVEVETNSRVVTIPSWQAILKAEKPVVIFCRGKDLPGSVKNESEELLVVVDLAVTQWDINRYFLVEGKEGDLQLQWLSSPSQKIHGQVVVIVKPRKILDEDNLTQPWQMDD